MIKNDICMVRTLDHWVAVYKQYNSWAPKYIGYNRTRLVTGFQISKI